MEKENFISGVKIIDGGMGGLEVCYSRVEKGKDGRDWINEYWTGRKYPINDELDGLVKAFRFYLYDVYGYDMGGVNDAELGIDEVKSEVGGFKIKGRMKVLDGTKVVKLETPKVLEEDGYVKYEEVMSLVGQLYRGVDSYMEGIGDVVVEPKKLLKKDYEKRGKMFDEAEFDGLSEGEKMDKATKYLEKKGVIVIRQEDMEGSPEVVVDFKDLGAIQEKISKAESVKEVRQILSSDTKDYVSRFPSEGVSSPNVGKITPMFSSPPVIDTPKPNFEPVVEVKPVAMNNFVDGDDDDMMLNIAPVKQVKF